MPTSVSDKKDKHIEDESNSSETLPVKDLSPESENDRSSGKNELEELRKLIIKPEGVSEVLPGAVQKSAEKDGKFAQATLPVVEENIRQSVARNPKILAEALFPVIGPAIRKAIAQALSSMMQSLNQTLEYSVSPKGLGWRLEALRTGKSFGEIVVLKTMLYRVEQVFLIHKETGLLLQHVVADSKDVQDADMVSAMLTAIEDFVQDSFKMSDGATLDSLKVRELSVWIEHSPDAVLASVIRGTPPLSLRETFSEAIEEIQLQHENELDNFNGRPEVFDESQPILDRCLQFRLNEKQREKTIFSPTNILAFVLGLLIVIGGFFYIRDYWRWSSYVEHLKNEPGIVVAEADHGVFSHSISGLRDPLSNDPKKLLSDYNLDEEDVAQNWKSYHDTNQTFILKRAVNLLNPPDTIQFEFENGILSAKGDASVEWFSQAKKTSLTLLGVSEFKVVENEKLRLKRLIEGQTVLFNCNTVELVNSSEIDVLKQNLEKLSDTVQNLKVEILGFSSKSGTENTNNSFSLKRAEKVKTELIERSIKLSGLQKANSQFIRNGLGKAANDQDCKAEVKVTFD